MKIKPLSALTLNAVFLGTIALLYPVSDRLKPGLAKETLEASDRACQNLTSSRPFAKTELFFGLSKPDGSQVSEAEFQRFLAREVTPRFPDGLTLLSGQGQFKNSDNILQKEPSKLMVLFYPIEQARGSDRKVQKIRQTYKLMFQQESVLQVDEISCVSF